MENPYKSIMLQKQVRNNSEDLQSEFLDMKNWEQEMRRADSEIANTGDNQIVPPIRKKKKSINESKESKSNKDDIAKTKRIKSSDYSAWDKFDATKACEAVDEEPKSDESEGESQETLQKNHAEATKHKIQGNVFVKNQEWAKAISCYNRAIKIFPYDAIFFANRALCHLKIDNFHSAESDCTAAVQLDEEYVKAYHRRATARIELKQLKEAAEDIKRVLKLDPSNREAQAMLVRVNKIFGNAKPSITSDTHDQVKDSAIERQIGQRLFNETEKNKKEDSDTKSITLKRLSDETKTAPDGKSRLKNSEKTIAKEAGKCKEDDVNELAIPKIESNSIIPEWLPETHEDAAIVQVITKPPHQRSKKALRTVPIETIQFRGGKETANESSNDTIESTIKISRATCAQPEAAETKIDDIPLAPKTSVQFLVAWRRNKCCSFRYQYLKQIPAERLPTLFEDSMESDTFSEILNLLRSEFTSRNQPVFEYLRYFTSVKRFRTLTMFMTSADKENLRMLFDYAKKVEKQANNVVDDICTKYEM